ncbi:circadian clock protein KaiB [Niastella caeni]|uniref:Circadian clock protein KaiB n=1 Tax=Niastella caeni TaxID=2569763 RepID=A0A4V4H1F4_9BACT|nr:circadian clock KaiB family protein [Niastella caeni]THU40256.1 circadian clock protein KaiB [Niastella caeni]
MKKQRVVNDLKNAAKPPPEYKLRLFVTGASPNSVRAITNIRNICDVYLKGRYELHIIDVYQDVALAQKEQLIALPLLIKKLPLPERKLIGDLSETEKVLKALEVDV